MYRLGTLLMIVAATATAAHFTLGNPRPGREQPVASLPGARADIDASQFPSLHAAMAALPPEGGLVRLPAGTFEITEPLVVRAGDACIVGSGTATHIINRNTDGLPALVLEHPQGASDRRHELWRIRLANFRITGNERSGHGIDARRINELFVDGVTVSEHGGDGIRLFYCYEDPRISDSLITYNRQHGVHLIGCHDIVVSANQFEENLVALRCTDGFNLAMTGNNLDDHLGDGVVIENTYGSVVAGNMIEECAGTAIILDRDCYGTTLSANVIAHNGGGIDLRDAHGCCVTGNTFTITKNAALRIPATSGRIAVSGNSFSDSYIGEGEVRRAANDREAGGLVLEDARNVGITGNVFSGLRPHGVAVEGNRGGHNVFTGNLLIDTPGQYRHLPSSVIADNLEHNIER